MLHQQRMSYGHISVDIISVEILRVSVIAEYRAAYTLILNDVREHVCNSWNVSNSSIKNSLVIKYRDRQKMMDRLPET